MGMNHITFISYYFPEKISPECFGSGGGRLSQSLFNDICLLSAPYVIFSEFSSCTSLPISSPANYPKYTMVACLRASRTSTTEPIPLSGDPNSSEIDDNKLNYVKFCRPAISDRAKTIQTSKNIDELDESKNEDGEVDLWLKMKDEAQINAKQEPILSNYHYNSILSHSSLEKALANHLSMTLSNSSLPSGTLFDVFVRVLVGDQEIMTAVTDDQGAVKKRNAAFISYFLNFIGFLACQALGMAHKFLSQGRKVLASLLPNRVSEVFAVDIHPEAKIGRGILFNHATGVVGEMAMIENNFSILHGVKLEGTGKECGDSHPKIGNGVLIGAGTCILGNIRTGDGAKIGAASVVHKDVPPRTAAVGNPARLVGGKDNPVKLDEILSFTMDHTSHINEWSDYVI